MTKERKASETWYIAATHYITSGFAIPYITSWIIGYLIFPYLGEDLYVTEAVSLAVWLLALWLGVMYSVRFLRKTYIIREPKRVVSLSSQYFLGVGVFFILGTFLFSGYMHSLGGTYFVLDAVGLLAGWYVFLMVSKKYVGTMPAE